MRSQILTSLAIAGLALGAGACGDKSDKLSKQELGKKADAICAKFKAKVKAVAEPANGADANQAVAYLDKVSPIVDAGVGELKALKPADDVRSAWDAYIAKEEEGGQVIKAASAKAKAKDASGLRDLQKLTAISAAAKSSARQAGATGCAKSEG